MKLYKVDTIIKNELGGQGLPIHFYARRAYLAMKFLRSINFDSAFIIKTKVYDYPADNIIALPDNYVGVVKIGVRTGEYLKELAPDNHLFNTIEIVPPETVADPVIEHDYYYGNGTAYVNVNMFGENTGGYYGVRIVDRNSYKESISASKIILNSSVANYESKIILQYITDGTTGGSPTGLDDGHLYVHPYAVDAMTSYINWMTASEGNRFVSRELRNEYYNELRKYRARINPLTKQMIIRSIRYNTHAAQK